MQKRHKETWHGIKDGGFTWTNLQKRHKGNSKRKDSLWTGAIGTGASGFSYTKSKFLWITIQVTEVIGHSKKKKIITST